MNWEWRMGKIWIAIIITEWWQRQRRRRYGVGRYVVSVYRSSGCLSVVAAAIRLESNETVNAMFAKQLHLDQLSLFLWPASQCLVAAQSVILANLDTTSRVVGRSAVHNLGRVGWWPGPMVVRQPAIRRLPIGPILLRSDNDFCAHNPRVISVHSGGVYSKHICTWMWLQQSRCWIV